MKSASELIAELNEMDEHLTIEAKASSEVGKALLEAVCAFSNEPGLGGGSLVLGVVPSRDTLWPSFQVLGVSNPDSLQGDVATACATAFNIPIRPTIRSEQVAGKTVLNVFVPEANPHEKPVYFKNQPLPQAAWRRIGSTDQRCTEEDLAVFYQDRRGDSYDSQVVRASSLDDIDVEAVKEYRQLREKVHPEAEELRWTDFELLEALGAVDRDDDRLKPTVAGILLFGTSKAIRRLFPMMRVDYIRIPSRQWVKDPDRRFDTVEILAPLIRAVQRIRAAVLDDLPRAFSLPAGAVQSEEMPLLPDRVIREVVANAVMHRSYRVHGSIQVIRYANRLEVRNPGYSLKAQERLGEPGSETRNPKIAAVLHDVNLAETKGSGIRVMRELMAEASMSPPVLESDRINNSFTALLAFHHFLGQSDIDWLCEFKEHGLSEEESRALISAREIGAINNQSYREINRGVDTLNASKHLRRLCNIGLLRKRSQGSSTYYIPTDAMMLPWLRIVGDGMIAESTSPKGAKSSGLEAQPSRLRTKSLELLAEPSMLSSKSLGAVESSKANERLKKSRVMLAPLPSPLHDEIRQLGKRATSAGDVQELVLKLCRWRELSVAEIAEYLHRAKSYIRQSIVQPLVKAGRLAYLHPNELAHPGQRYRTVDRKDA